MIKILFVDDDSRYQIVIKNLLESEGYEVFLANDAAEGLGLFNRIPFQLIISDLKMVSIDGLQFLSLIKKIDERAKVIILTGSDNDDDEVKGLTLNASDYIKKSASLSVLLQRIKKVLSEESTVQQEMVYSNKENIKVNLRERHVYRDNQLIELTLKEYELLLFFLKNKNIVLPREQIIKEIWQTNPKYVDSRNVDNHIKNLRTKLKLSSIYSIRGVGYEWFE
ncbi:response regulator transcription factor [Isobaculum melis]|uniref:Two-component system, OmpR family, response regulator VanR n=1 Tax=Isobaculum melis TaxID=142588 RepID=A0A1H9SVR9_9LACT|nr:response regulator transcription factor [Isobaculum melis]SER88483.1 two-component system, OmpR family, response regulator VanR [Isobaculum melis]